MQRRVNFFVHFFYFFSSVLFWYTLFTNLSLMIRLWVVFVAGAGRWPRAILGRPLRSVFGACRLGIPSQHPENVQRKSRADGIQIRRVGGVVCQGNSPVVTDEKGAGFLSFVCRLRNTKQYTEIPVGGETHKGLHTPSKKKPGNPGFVQRLGSCSSAPLRRVLLSYI